MWIGVLLTLLAPPTEQSQSFVLHSIRDDLPTGPITQLSRDGAVQIGAHEVVPFAEIVSLVRKGAALPQFPHNRPYIILSNGDRIPGTVAAIVNDEAIIQSDLGTIQELSVPLTSIAAILFSDAAATRAATPAGQRLLSESRSHDIAQLSNGDTIQGTLIGLDKAGMLRLDVAGRPIEIARDQIQSLMLNSRLTRVVRPKSAYWQLVVSNGARLSVRSAEISGQSLRATTPAGRDVSIPLTSIVAMNVRQGRAVYLSDRTPKSYEQTPFFGVRWPLMNDRSVARLEIRLAGDTYDKGIGLHSRSRVTYALPAGSLRFEACVGLDAITGRLGNVRIVIEVDGKPLLMPFDLKGTDAPRSLRITLPPGGRELALLVDYGLGGDIQDHVNWADARIITEP